MAYDDVIIIERSDLLVVSESPLDLIVAGSQGPAGTFPPSAGAGIVVADGIGGYAARMLVSLTAALAITNASGVAGNPTLQLTGTTLAAYGIADAYTKVASDARFAPIAVPWASITGTPTTATGYGIASIDNVPIGATTANTGRFSTFTATGVGTLPGAGGWTSTGELGIRINGATDRALQLGLPSSANSTLYSSFTDLTAPATVTSALYGHHTRLSSAAAAFTVGNLVHYAAFSGVAGAGSTITNVRGFWAFNAIAVGANNFGFYSDINVAANTWQLYLNGSAFSYFGAPFSMYTTAAAADIAVRIGNDSTMSAATLATVAGVSVSLRAPATTTTSFIGYQSTLHSAVAAFTLADLTHYKAVQTVQGAGSTITNVRGFWAASAVAVGANNYGFYTDFTLAANKWAFFSAGAAESMFLGGFTVGNSSGISTTGSMFRLLGANVHPQTTTTVVGMHADFAAPATATTGMYQFYSVLRSSASAFTLTNAVHYYADNIVQGAGSTITNAYAFYVAANFSATSAATNMMGFRSDMAAGTGKFSFYGGGTANSYFGGNVVINHTGTSVPANSLVIGAPLSQATTSVHLAIFTATGITSTSTTAYWGISSTLGTAASAFTLSSLVHYYAQTTTLGAGSAITTCFAFRADAGALNKATTNYAYYTDIASGSASWAFYGAGTASTFFAGAVNVNANPSNTDRAVRLAQLSTMSAVAQTIVEVVPTFASTATTSGTGIVTNIASAATAFTMGSLIHFQAGTTTKGAGSTITTLYGFQAANAIVNDTAASTTYGFHSGLNVGVSATVFAFYGAGTADSSFGGAILCRSPSAGLGYSSGAGGTVAQITSKATGVTLNKNTGQITMNAAALGAGAAVAFVVTNTAVAATDLIVANVVSGGTANAYRVDVTAIGAGSFTVTVVNITAGSLSEAPVIGFAIIKGVTA